MLSYTIKHLPVRRLLQPIAGAGGLWPNNVSARNFKVAVVGAGGGIGQSLSLLLKLNPLVTELVLHDVVHSLGVAADCSHIDTPSRVEGYVKPESLPKALKCADVVVCVAGVPRKPGMSRDDLFKVNANIVQDVASIVGSICPTALFAVVTNPVNSCVPIAAEVLKDRGHYDPNRLFGVTTLDMVRSRTFISQILDIEPQKVKINVVGGHSNLTMIPVISQCKPEFKQDQKTIEQLTHRIQDAGTEVVKAKAGAGSATISMAHSAALFTNSLLRGLNGEKNVVECSYVESCVTDAKFFATPLVLGKDGIKENLGLPELNEYECCLLEKSLPILKKNIETGIQFTQNNRS